MGENQTLGLPAASPGTKTAVWVNAIGTLLTAAAGFQGVVPPQYGIWIGMAAMLGNTFLHGMTGNSAPVIGGK